MLRFLRAAFVPLIVSSLLMEGGSARSAPLELAGLAVTPHRVEPDLRYRRDREPGLGARVQVFLRNGGDSALTLGDDDPIRVRGVTPDELVRSNAWTWHDLPSSRPGQATMLPPGTMTVWSFNTRDDDWGVGTSADLVLGGTEGHEPATLKIAIERPTVWLSAVTFLGRAADPVPNSMVVHVANESGSPIRLKDCRLWLPDSTSTFRVLRPGPILDIEPFAPGGTIAAHDRGGARVATGRLPLSYVAVEIRIDEGDRDAPRSLWAHLRVKREAFDISGGWVASDLGGGRNSLQAEPYLKTLARMHINAGQHQAVPGYTDNPSLYDRYPLKYMNKCEPIADYDTDAVLPRVHAVEFLGEPQYGGGRPVPPMEVWRAFAPYQSTRLPTSVTHSEERVWRYYAGLSDFPHFDAYRVCAPAPDSWVRYDRWDGKKISWGAPLETTGSMTRSLRELNRPAPIASWSQGAHDGWGRYGGRQRTSPTPDELRSQAYQALGNRITSLYWFNLSVKSLLKFRDLIEPITRVNREVRMLDRFCIEGDAYEYRRVTLDGRPDWDLSSIAGPEAAILFANDLAYAPDLEQKVFRFSSPRAASFTFRLPAHLRDPRAVIRVDADGVHDVDWKAIEGGVEIRDQVGVVAIYLAVREPKLRDEIAARHRELIAREASFGFDPARSDEDFEILRGLLRAPSP